MSSPLGDLGGGSYFMWEEWEEGFRRERRGKEGRMMDR